MIDHILLDVIAALREALESSLLEQQAVEERFQVDVFLGDISFETSYSLPGEQNPPRMRADLRLEWPTWSQSSYRLWSIGEAPAELPELIMEVSLRLQRLADVPELSVVLAALDATPPIIAGHVLEQTGPTIEQVFDSEGKVAASSVEVTYQGVYRLDESVLRDPDKLDEHVVGLVRWIASGLVRLADLDLPILPADDPRAN